MSSQPIPAEVFHGHADGIRAEPLADGNVSFKFLRGNEEVLSGVLTPQQVTGIVALLLNAATGAFQETERDPRSVTYSLAELPVHTTGFGLAVTKVRGRYAIVAQAGEASIGLAIERRELRRLARTLIAASYGSGSTDTTARLLCELLADFFNDLTGWGDVFSARFKAASRRLAISFSSKVSGRSLRVFRAIQVSPTIAPPNYAKVGECVYCGSRVYSDAPGIRRVPLGAEHIIPEGLDGNLELPDASCRPCEGVTSRLERDVLLRTLKALRLFLKIRGKRKSSRPVTLPLTVPVNNVDTVMQMPVEDYPVIFNMPVYGAPRVFSGGAGGNQPTSGFTMIMLRYDARMLKNKYGITTFSSAMWDTHMLFRMLGKIGHAFAVAEIGLERFRPLLCDMIRTGSTDAFNHIGGEATLETPTKALHELGLGYQRHGGKDYVVARIRLFASNNGPTYYVVVGESLERPIAKFNRVLSSRISRMLVR